MNTIIKLVLISALVTSINYDHFFPTAAVCLVGGTIKARQHETVKKYKRKDCPVCKGKGWYISGDGIAKVDCGYCEPETDKSLELEEISTKTEIIKVKK